MRRLAILAFVLGPCLVAWVRPKSPSSLPVATSAADQLDYVLFTVNGKPRLVPKDGELIVVRGDTLQVTAAAAVNRAPLKEVNVVGFQARWTKAHPNTNDDRGVTFKTEELTPKHSESEKGEVYAVTAAAKKHLAGAVYLRLIDPVLRFAEISVNGQRRVLRDGEALSAKTSDMVKVEAVKTNLEGTSDVIFQIVPVGGEAKAKSANPGAYEIRFVRGGFTFARIPLNLERG